MGFLAAGAVLSTERSGLADIKRGEKSRVRNAYRFIKEPV